jgi:hypothetical protein
MLRYSDWSPSDRLANFVVALQEVTTQLCAQAKQRDQNTIPRPIYLGLDRSKRSIRLLCFSNGNTATSVCATLHTFPIVECPPYIALSYTWEPRYPLEAINLNGQNVAVGKNLFDALHTISGSMVHSIQRWHIFIERIRRSNASVLSRGWTSDQRREFMNNKSYWKKILDRRTVYQPSRQ